MRDFARLDEQDHVYLDYTGSGLYGTSRIRRHAEALLATILGNPHSANPTSKASTDLLEHCRQRVLRHRLDPKTAGAVRVSLGLASNFDDVFAFVEFARGFLEGR